MKVLGVLGLASALAPRSISDLEGYCLGGPRVAGVFAVFDAAGAAQFVGMARDAKSALARLAATQEEENCRSARVLEFEKPSRAEMDAVREEWVAALGPPATHQSEGSRWSRPPLTQDQAERKLRLRQAIADSSLRDEDPEAWGAVVRKAMKDGDFDGSDSDGLDAQIRSDERATMRRAAGDWQQEVQAQTEEALRPEWQTARLEMYVARGCARCDRVRAALRKLGAYWTEVDLDALPEDADDDITRRARHARFETVPQLYVLRAPPLNGRPAEWLVGGADDLDAELKIPETTAFSFKGRISDPAFLSLY
ncbi:hypothetical protein CTAYLR_000153 [Chrysophaeum taylorii]|uniref:Glutaredoxin domain-containing protein n=1 Tax=Chrysophaeum taylorii TaxID=2483200 RepID=A0AAD7XK76_9STRA|nr:hypothetical protein CTAYLR_000153 [Chrysophaeum taylorii]